MNQVLRFFCDYLEIVKCINIILKDTGRRCIEYGKYEDDLYLWYIMISIYFNDEKTS